MTDTSGLPQWQIHGERVIYDNRWVQLTLMDIEPPGTPRFEHHVVRLHHVAIAAIVDEEHVLMLQRYRFVPDKWGWELPGGIIDPGEEPANTASRETEEETGWRPVSELEHLLTFQPMVGMVDSPHDLFIGRGAERVADTPADGEEAGKVAWIPLSDVPGMIERDELLGSGTLVALLHIMAMRMCNNTTAGR